MAKATLKCPNCGQSVEVGEVECPHCGVNLKTGESYEERIKKAKGKARHRERLTGGLYVAGAVAFCLCMFAGHQYQKKVEKVLGSRPDLFAGWIEEMQQIRDLTTAGDRLAASGQGASADVTYAQARERATTLIQELGKTADRIKLDDTYSPNPRALAPGQVAYDKRGTKRLLNNLKAKAEFHLSQIPPAEIAE